MHGQGLVDIATVGENAGDIAARDGARTDDRSQIAEGLVDLKLLLVKGQSLGELAGGGEGGGNATAWESLPEGVATCFAQASCVFERGQSLVELPVHLEAPAVGEQCCGNLIRVQLRVSDTGSTNRLH